MAQPNSPTAGGPSGSTFAGPLHVTKDMANSTAMPQAFPLGPFQITDVDTVLDQPLLPAGSAGFSSVVSMPKIGSIVGMSIDSNATWTAGAPTFKVEVGGVTTMQVSPGTGATTKTRFTTNLTSYVYQKSDAVKIYVDGVAGTTAPTTVDASVFIWIV